MIKKNNIKKYFGSSEDIQRRYEKMYGAGDYKKKAKEIQNDNAKKYLLCIFIIVTIMIIIFIEDQRNRKSINLDEKGIVKELVRQNEIADNIRLELFGIYDDELFNRKIDIRVPSRTEKEYENNKEEKIEDISIEKKLKLDTQIREVLYSINSDDNLEKITLPDKLLDGTQIQWRVSNDKYKNFFIIFILLIFYLIYRGRFSKIDQEERRAKNSIIMELPEFINKLVLFLDTGMVFSTAFIKIVQDNSETEWKQNSYFYNQLYRLMRNVRERNHVLHKEFENFAVRSQVKEFIRISNIVTDNVNKGTTLTKKLRKEGDELWLAQKRYIEEKGRLAETKLVGPLLIMLIILIVITVAPAILVM